MRVLMLLLFASVAGAGEVSWANLGDGKRATAPATAKPRPAAVVEEDRDCDCGCAPCRCAEHAGVCPCGKMPKAKAQASPPKQPSAPLVYYYTPPVMQSPAYMPATTPLYWGGIGGGYAGASCST